MVTFCWSALVPLEKSIIYLLPLPQPVCNAAGLWAHLPSPVPTHFCKAHNVHSAAEGGSEGTELILGIKEGGSSTTNSRFMSDYGLKGSRVCLLPETPWV